MATSPCQNITLQQLRSIASANKDKIKGYSRLRKDELCQSLAGLNLLPGQQIEPLPEEEEQAIGIIPPNWDLDHLSPIPDLLLPYWYIYAAGSGKSEIVRLFILPENFSLTAVTLPSIRDKQPRLEFQITVADWLYSPETYINKAGEELRIDQALVPGLQRAERVNQIAPRIGSEQWYDIVDTMQIFNQETGKGGGNPQLRYQYQIIQDIPYSNRTY